MRSHVFLQIEITLPAFLHERIAVLVNEQTAGLVDSHPLLNHRTAVQPIPVCQDHHGPYKLFLFMKPFQLLLFLNFCHNKFYWCKNTRSTTSSKHLGWAHCHIDVPKAKENAVPFLIKCKIPEWDKNYWKQKTPEISPGESGRDCDCLIMAGPCGSVQNN